MLFINHLCLRSKRIFTAFVFCATLFASCKKNNDAPFTEPAKSVVGTWQIVKATRNGTDLMPYVDFSKFRLNFKDDSTYTIDNLLPFIVSKKGSYSLDDPQYPFKISFRQDGSTSPITTGFSYPVVMGKRQIAMSFSLGCTKNNYQYTFERIEP